MKWRKVPVIPIKRRARHHNGITYTDSKTRDELRMVAESWDGEFYEDEPLVLVVLVYKQLPKTTPKKVGRLPFIQKPDGDNVLKAVMDGLNGVAFRDDSQIVKQIVWKVDRTRDIDGGYIEYLLCKSSEVSIWVQVNG